MSFCVCDFRGEMATLPLKSAAPRSGFDTNLQHICWYINKNRQNPSAGVIFPRGWSSQCALQSETVTSVAPRSLVCVFSPHSAGSSALTFSASDAQPASDGELCRHRMKREVDLTMPLWCPVGGCGWVLCWRTGVQFTCGRCGSSFCLYLEGQSGGSPVSSACRGTRLGGSRRFWRG